MKTRYIDDKRLSLLLFFTAWILYACIYASKNCFNSAMASIVSEGILTKTQTGMITAVFYISYAIFQFIGGFASDKYAPDKLITVGVVGAAICNLIIYFVHNYVVILTVWAFNGVIQFGIWPSVYKIIVTELKPSQRYNGAFYICVAGLVGMVFSYALAAIVNKWEDNFLASTVILLACAIIWNIIYKSIEKKMTICENDEIINTKSEFAKNSSKVILKSGIVLMFPAILLHFLLMNGLKTYMPLMMMESYDNLSPRFVTSLNILPVFLCIFGIYIAGMIYPKHIKNELLAMIAMYFPATICAGILLFLGKANVILVYVMILLTLTLQTGVSQFTSAFIPNRFLRYGCVGTASGIINGIASFGNVLMNFGIAYLADVFGWTITIRIIMIAFAIVMVSCIVTMPKWNKFINKKEK